MMKARARLHCALAFVAALGCARVSDLLVVEPEPRQLWRRASIQGVVRNSNTDEAISNARVVLECDCLNEAPTVLTDERGMYSFDGLPKGNYAVRIAAGQADVSKVFELPRNTDFRANFSVDPEAATRVVISADPPRPIGYDCIDCEFPLGHSPPIYLRTTVGNSLRDAVEAQTY
jgi:hypothetical protein